MKYTHVTVMFNLHYYLSMYIVHLENLEKSIDFLKIFFTKINKQTNQ